MLRISSSALRLARSFLDEARRASPDVDWVVCFDWADSRRVRRPGTNDWSDLGAGIDVTAYEREHVPSTMIQLIDGLEVLIKIRSDVWQRSRQKLIDTDETFSGRVVLR
jgi:hypothetical protein